MKQPKRLTYDQKKKLARKKLNPDEYMLVQETVGEYVLYQKETAEIVCVRK